MPFTPTARTPAATLSAPSWEDRIQKVRGGGRIINVHALIAVGVNADGHREILGIDVATAEDGAGWPAFLRSLIARGLSGVQLVISDAHAGLVDTAPWPSAARPALPSWTSAPSHPDELTVGEGVFVVAPAHVHDHAPVPQPVS